MVSDALCWIDSSDDVKLTTNLVPTLPEKEEVDETTIAARPRSEDLLQWLGQPGFRPKNESLKELVDAIVSVA